MTLRNLPSVERVLSTQQVSALLKTYSHSWIVNVARECIDEARSGIRNGFESPSLEQIADRVSDVVRVQGNVHHGHIINATGVVIHTNLGRAPLSQDAINDVRDVSYGYSSLELDLEKGQRGSRQSRLKPILRQLTGAESSLVVNNNAAAVLLGLSAICAYKDVIVSRGEAVEIGGGFRIPDVMAQSGASVVEVGTTNRTYASDYEQAICGNTSALLKVHSSNFKVTGFTHSPDLEELVYLGRKYDLPVLHDIGSGCFMDTRPYGLTYEPRPQDSVKNGADLVFFSGDKLLGGPQSGIVVGTSVLINRLEQHPLARAVRMDKMGLTALTTTLMHYLKGEVVDKVPVWRMISASDDSLRERASMWFERIGDRSKIIRVKSTIGGGSLPGELLNSWGVAVSCNGFPGGVESLAQLLRKQDPGVIARIEKDHLILDARTVLPEEEEGFLMSILKALG